MSLKCLMIGNIKELSGWSLQLHNHALALDSAGVDLTLRNINIINNTNPDLHPRVQELLRKDCANPDIIILNTLPNYYEKTGRAKSVGYFVCETSNFRASDWASRMNLMDINICPCYHNKVAAIDSGVKTKLEIVPECVDISKYEKEYPTHPIREQHKDKFLFLTVAEWTTRKNIDAIVKAFHLEFSPAEPVELVIKTTPAGMQNPQVEINAKLEAIKQGLKLYNSTDRYKRENVICGFLSETDMCSLMQSVDCLVNASRGEAFCIPVMDAFGFGKTVVSPDHSGLDYVNDKNAFVVDSIEQPCFGAMDTLPDLYVGTEYWREVRLQALRAHMRSAYEKRSLATKKIQAGRETVKKYSLENVGQIYRKVLEKL